jgi:O-antigen ligase
MSRNKFFLFLYAATTRVFIDLVGRLMLAEVIAVFTLPFINIKRLLNKYKLLRVVLSGLSVLLLAQIVSDIVNQSDSSDYLKGWAVMVFSMASIIYLVNYLSKNPNGIIYYLFAMFLIHLIFGSGDLDLGIWEENTNYFKVRFVGFLNPGVMLGGYYLFSKHRIKTTVFLFFVYALVCIVFDARSNGLIFMIASMLLYIKTIKIKFTRGKILKLGIIGTLFLYFAYFFYVNQVLYHDLGGTNAHRQLNLASNPYNPFELLYIGRSEFPVLFQAAMDKPLFGHGSWGKDPSGKYTSALALIVNKETIDSAGYIRAHSVFLGTWAYAGIVGFMAILIVFYLLFKHFFKLYKSQIVFNFFPIIVVLSVDMLWAYFFSPIGILRTSFPIFAALIITSLNIKKVRFKHA